MNLDNSFLQMGTPQSSMRLAFMIMVITVCLIALISVPLCIALNRDMLGGVAAVVGALSAFAFGGKSIQAYSENKYALNYTDVSAKLDTPVDVDKDDLKAVKP